MASWQSWQFPLFEAAAWEVEEDAKRGEYSGGRSAVRREGVLCYKVAAGIETSAVRGALSALLCASSAGKPPASAKRVSKLAGWRVNWRAMARRSEEKEKHGLLLRQRDLTIPVRDA